jgi:arabinosaccharide transport system permease protein
MRVMNERSRAMLVLKYAVLTLTALLMLFPVYALILSSFRPGRELMRYGVGLTTLVPTNLNLEMLKGLLTYRDGLYLVWYRNSLVISILQMAVSLSLSSFVGYGLAVYRFRGRGFFLALVIFVMMFPLQILILPLYRLMTTLGAMNTYWGVLLPFAVSPFAVFFFRQFAGGIPKDFLDAARIDGLGEFAIFFRLAPPLMAPAFAAMAILLAQQSWNGFLWPLIVMRTNDMFTLPLGLNSLLTPYGNNYDVLIAGSSAASIPIVILFFVFQRYFISGLNAGGIKG